jgi:hypothetical protein
MWFNDLSPHLQPALQNDMLPEVASQPGHPAIPIQAYTRLSQGWLGVIYIKAAQVNKPAWLIFIRCCLGDWLIKLGTRLKGQLPVNASSILFQ